MSSSIVLLILSIVYIMPTHGETELYNETVATFGSDMEITGKVYEENKFFKEYKTLIKDRKAQRSFEIKAKFMKYFHWQQHTLSFISDGDHVESRRSLPVPRGEN